MDRSLIAFFAVLLVGICAASKSDDVADIVSFRLFTVNNKYDQHNLGFDADNLTSSGFDFQKDTKLITHGFLNNGSGMSCIALRDAYLRHHDYNVIIVDYKDIAYDLLMMPNDKISTVGPYVAKFIDFLIESGLDIKKIHLLGHSLGSHVMAYAAKLTTKGKIPRVSGLDPGLMMGGEEYTINKDVAEYVDVIHTCRGVYGMINSCGTVDFFPNGGGATQPSCGLLGGVTCSHYEAVRFMVRTIGDTMRYPSRKCDSLIDFELGKCDDNELAYMGDAAALPAEGDYYLATEKEETIE